MPFHPHPGVVHAAYTPVEGGAHAVLLLLSRPAVIERCPSWDPAGMTGGVPGADGPSGVPSDALPRPSARLPEGSEYGTAAVATALATIGHHVRISGWGRGLSYT